MTRKALGRGINALFSGPVSVEQDDVLQEVDIDLLEPNADQPRTRFREDKLEELAASIRANGIVQPILVRRQGQHFQIIAGERRWRAAQRAGLERVPVVVRDIPDERVLELSLIENIQREELNPIEEANAYRRLIEGLGITQEDVARRVGRERSSVTNYLRLLRLPEEIQQWVEEDKLSMGHARALLSLEQAERQRDLALEVIARSLSVRETERFVKKLHEDTSRRRGASRSEGSEDANVRAAEEKLSRRLGTKVRIQRLKQGGKIEIYFYSDPELDNIYNIVMGG
jgi:ParB family chromosome partitioning protein